MSVSDLKQKNVWLHRVQPFLVGGLSGCCATVFVQPIDMVKVRIQLLGNTPNVSRNPFLIARNIVKTSGIMGLYKGLDAGLVRQITYTTTRMGMFRVISDALKKDDKPLPLQYKAFAGLASGAIGSLIGNPADLALIRLQTDATLPLESRANYTGVSDALCKIVRKEGVLSLWRGSGPTVFRAMALNMGMLASFDQAKELLQQRFGAGWTSTLLASAISGWFAVTFSLPFDFIKTRMQRMKPDPITQKLPYTSMMNCAYLTWKEGGFLGFYRGYLTYYVRIAPHSMLTLLFVDFANKKIFKERN